MVSSNSCWCRGLGVDGVMVISTSKMIWNWYWSKIFNELLFPWAEKKISWSQLVPTGFCVKGGACLLRPYLGRIAPTHSMIFLLRLKKAFLDKPQFYSNLFFSWCKFLLFLIWPYILYQTIHIQGDLSVFVQFSGRFSKEDNSVGFWALLKHQHPEIRI